MSDSLEYKCESVIIAILGASAGLSGFAIKHRDEDTAANKDRIVVSSSQREVELYGKDLSVVRAWRINCMVELLYVTKDESGYDDKITAIEAALGAAQPPASVQALWASTFTIGAQLEQTSEGEASTDDKTRERRRTYAFIVMN